jgi:protein-S-isoprenylcysteine O-methyltransferase Ste14
MAATRFLLGVLVLAAMLFVPSGTLDFWQAWAYLGVLFIPVATFGFFLFTRDPELLEKRMRTRETESTQRRATAAMSLALLAALLIPGFDRRYGWSQVPPYLAVAADLVILLGYLLFVITIRENRYASRVVEVQQDQVVIATGPYALVRHPMYLAATLIFVLSPLALGSYWGLLPAVLFPILLGARIENEELLLRRALPGYDEYTHKVKRRLIPFVW